MKHPILLKQALRKIHTPAICDSGAPCLETHASAGSAGSTGQNQAVHGCGPWACLTKSDAALSTEGGQ